MIDPSIADLAKLVADLKSRASLAGLRAVPARDWRRRLTADPRLVELTWI